MSRVSIEPADKELFECTLRVRVADLNYGNHLANDKILAFAQEARVLFLEAHQASELNFFGTSLIQGDAAIQYKSEGFLGNEIQIKIGVNDVGNSSFDFVYQMENLTTGKTLAVAKTRMVCFNYGTRKVQPVPEGFKSIL